MAKFDKSFRALHTLTSKIVEEKSRLNVEVDQPHPALTNFNTYMKHYEDSKTRIHKKLFDNLYQEYKVDILKGYTNDKWLTDNKVVITWNRGEGKDCKILLSIIYRTACALKRETEERVKRLPDKAKELCKETLYPKAFLLHLYRIFSCSNDENVDELKNCISELETNIGVPKAPEVKPSESTSSPLPQAQNLDLGSLIGGLFNGLTSAINTISNNPEAKNIIDSLGEGMQTNEPEKILPELLKKFGDEGTRNKVMSVFAPAINNIMSSTGMANLNISAPPVVNNVPAIENPIPPSQTKIEQVD